MKIQVNGPDAVDNIVPADDEAVHDEYGGDIVNVGQRNVAFVSSKRDVISWSN
jgi:hypothetical protein